MNIQLFLEGQEVELTNAPAFPLNKSYENLYNPTDILVEYSKSIDIPITAKNNKILGHAYRLDKSVYTGDGANIGLYLNPLKRIPFKLLYNGGLILDGYAKFVSANKSAKESTYTINLIGKLGDVFHELKSVVTSESKLGDLNRNYLITKEECCNDYSNYMFNAYFANKSFENDLPKFWNHLEEGNYITTDVFGLAPAHRGLYQNFDSKKIQTNGTTIMEVSEYLTNKWIAKNPNYNVTGASDIVGDGFKDYQMREFRAYQLKPYMYFSHLMKIFVNKCKQLTDYTIELDRDWFNFNNPYWSRLCYMFDYLDNANPTVQSGVKKLLMEGDSTETINSKYEDGNTCGMIMTTMSTMKQYGGSIDGYIIAPFDINFGCAVTPTSPLTNGSYIIHQVRLMDDTFYTFDVDVYRRTSITGSHSLVGTYKFWTAKSSDIDTGNASYNKDNYLQLKGGGAGGGIMMSTRAMVQTDIIRHNVTIPQIPVSGDFEYGMELYVTVAAENFVGHKSGNYQSCALYSWDTTYKNGNVIVNSTDSISPSDAEQYATGYESRTASFFTSFEDIYSIENWKTNTEVSLETIWQKDTPLFDVVLEYTKMFGLHWDIDYANKKINLMTRKNMFKNYTVEDWNSKVDKSKDFIIEPITFSDRYAVFNYKDTDGYIYSNYKNKYGVNIGEKRLNTGYEFNTTEKDLFKDINPTSMSSKSYVSFDRLTNWDAKSIINPEVESFVLLDYESEDEKSAISLNNWCFRALNKTDIDVYISDDTPLMMTNSISCYTDKRYMEDTGASCSPYNGMPQFTMATDFYGAELIDDRNVMGMVFNQPNEDYTYNQSVSYIGENDIYNQFWRDYMNERYNAQNKKVTAYIRLTLADFNNFKFNKLVTVDNQLFMVNKIIDFDPEKGASTKVELIQIQDPNSLTSTTFRDRAITVKRLTSSSIVVKAIGLPIYSDISFTGNIEEHLEDGDGEYGTHSYERYLYFDDDTGISGDVIMRNKLGEELKITINL